MSKSSKSDSINYGATPRVHLLPPEIERDRRLKVIRRRLLFGLGGAVAAVIAAVLAVTVLVGAAALSQAAEQQRGLALTTEFKKYSAVTDIQNQIREIEAGEITGTEGEILWDELITSIVATLPADTSVTDFTAQLATADDVSPSTNPLDGPYIAKLSMTARGPQASIQQWLGNLPNLKGIVSATPGEIAISPDDGVYIVSVNMLISNDVLSNRFAPETDDATDTEDTTP